MTEKNILHIKTDNINKHIIDELYPYIQYMPSFLNYMKEPAGKEHYKLLAYISSLLKPESKIADVGTYHGASALCLSSNPQVYVTTYDIYNMIPINVPNLLTPLSRSNVKMKVMSGQLDIVNISKSDFILLDIDPHDGIQETKFVELLIKNNFKGILMLDDIYVNKEMQEFWNNLPQNLKKIDVSKIGHWTGTGIVVFDENIYDVIID